MRLVGELARRKVLKVGAAYLGIAWLLLQLTDILAPAFGLPAWTLKPVLLLLVTGFPVALLLAWYFNVGEAGLEAESPAPAVPTRTRTRDWALLAAIALLGIGVGVAAQRMLGAQQAPASPANGDATREIAKPAPAIAVLPFASLGGSTEDGHFADGLSEEILNTLANVDGLRVIGRTSAFSYKGRKVDARTVGRELGVGHIVEGSVRRQGDQLRVTAQLIDTQGGFDIWSQTFDRPAGDALAIQNEIARAIAERLQLSLPPPSATWAPLPATAQVQYLRAVAMLRDPDSLEHYLRGVDELRTLHRAHPDFLPAYLPLAQGTKAEAFTRQLTYNEALAQLRDLQQGAQRRAPKAFETRALAAVLLMFQNEFRTSYLGSAKVFETLQPLAIEAPNNPWLLNELSTAAQYLNMTEVELEISDRYLAIEPKSIGAHIQRAYTLMHLGRREESIATARTAIRLGDGAWDLHEPLGDLQFQSRDFDGLLDTVEACKPSRDNRCLTLLRGLMYMLRKQTAYERIDALGRPERVAQGRDFKAAAMRGGYREARRWVEQQDNAHATLDRFKNQLSVLALQEGKDAEAVAVLKLTAPGIFEAGQPITSFDLWTACRAAIALARTGEDAQAREVYTRVLAAARLPVAQSEEALLLPEAVALAGLGRLDEAMTVVRGSIGKGWRHERELTEMPEGTLDPIADPLRAHKDFQPLMEKVRADNARLFARLRPRLEKLLNDPALAGATPVLD